MTNKEKYQQMFDINSVELEVKIEQHNMGIRFNAAQMQNIRTAWANVKFAVEMLKNEPGVDIQQFAPAIQHYNFMVAAIEQINANNPDRNAYIANQPSPIRGKKQPKMPPLFHIKNESKIHNQKQARSTLQGFQLYIQNQGVTLAQLEKSLESSFNTLSIVQPTGNKMDPSI
ncbi:MAG: hypothetical protein ABSF18_03930 [Gammaproteobacteria bacterium]|jgi:hypothetical protein